jgi:hypothetical protein
MWSRDLRDLDPTVTALALFGSTFTSKLQSRPIVMEVRNKEKIVYASQ